MALILAHCHAVQRNDRLIQALYKGHCIDRGRQSIMRRPFHPLPLHMYPTRFQFLHLTISLLYKDLSHTI